MFGHVERMTRLHRAGDLSYSLYINHVRVHKPLTITVIRYKVDAGPRVNVIYETKLDL